MQHIHLNWLVGGVQWDRPVGIGFDGDFKGERFYSNLTGFPTTPSDSYQLTHSLATSSTPPQALSWSNTMDTFQVWQQTTNEALFHSFSIL